MSPASVTRLLVAAVLVAPFAAACGSSHPSSGATVASSGGETLAVTSGDKQTGTVGAVLALPLVVVVEDASSQPISGATVTFAVVLGGGSLSAATATTDGQGLARTTLTLGSSPGPGSVTATAGANLVAFTQVALAPGASQLSASPASVVFGSVGVGAVGSAALTLTNDGADAVAISGASVAGAGFGAMGLAFPLTLAAGQSVTLTATFTPATLGGATGDLTIASSGVGGPTTVALGGTGGKLHSVTLTWNASTTTTVVGYNVYRGVVSGGPYQKINPSLVVGTTYKDTAVQAGMTYYYVTSSVDANGAESGFSNETVATIPTP